jgi:hypothetical protein
MNSKHITDRRKHQRFKAREGSFAALQPSQAVGEITNISKDGLAVHYALYDRVSEASSEVMIFFATDRFQLKKIPCKTISDFQIEESQPFSSISMRRCGLQFGGLTEEQKSQLEYFIDNYTAGYA